MLSAAMNCGRSTVLRKIAFRNHQLVRNLFILGLSSVGRYQVATADQISAMNPIINEVAPAAMNYCTKPIIPVAEYEEVKDLPNHPEKLLIDVREPIELKETGQIPTSINIPLGIVGPELAFNVTSEQFQQKYGRPKPDIDSYIIVHCRSGKRSQQAAEVIACLGYKKVHNYVGSWLDWAKRENLPA